MEFFILVGVVSLIVIIFIATILDQIKEFQDKREYLLIKDAALKLQKEVYLAAIAEDGYTRQFTMPSKLEDVINYSITTGNNGTLVIYTDNFLYAVPVPEVTGTITKSTNTITKTGGVVNLN